MSKDTKGNHPAPSEDSLLQSKIRCPIGRAGSSPASATNIERHYSG